MTEEQADVRVELARLRQLEQGLRAERERIRAAAAGEVHQLQTALRESAARAAQHEREAQGLRAQLQRASGGGRRLRRRRPRSEPDTTGAVQRVLASFERERQQLEERARAVAQTELRQRKTQAHLDAEMARLAKASEGDDGQQQLLAELRAAQTRVADLERQLHDHEETKVALDSARGELARLSRTEQPPAPQDDVLAKERDLLRREEELSRREIELSLVRRRIGEEERRLQERAWRTGALERRRRGAIAPRPGGELTFSEGWQLLSRGSERPAEQSDWGGGNW